MDDNTIVLNIDESPAQRAIDRVNAGLDSIEQHAARAGRAISSGISTGTDAAQRFAQRLADQAEAGFHRMGTGAQAAFAAVERFANSMVHGIASAFTAMHAAIMRTVEGSTVGLYYLLTHLGSIRRELTDFAKDHLQTGVNIARGASLIQAARTSYVAASPGPVLLRAGEMAVAIAVEEALRTANNRGKLYEDLAFTAAKDEYDLSDVAQLRVGSRLIGKPDNFLRTATDALYEQVTKTPKGGGANDAQKTLQGLGIIRQALGYDITEDPRTYSELIANIGRAFDDIHDPVARAQKAIALFGGDAKQVLPELNSGMSASIEKATRWGAVLGDEQQANIAKFRENVGIISRFLNGLTNDFSLAGEAIKNWYGNIGARLGNWAFGLVGIGGPKTMDTREEFTADANARGLALVNSQQQRATDADRRVLALLLGSQSRDAMDAYSGTRAGISQQMSEAESKRNSAGRLLELQRRGMLRDQAGQPMNLSVEQQVLYEQQYLAGTQETRLYKNQLQGLEDSRRGIEAAIKTRDEAAKERGQDLSALDKISFDFAFALRPQYIVDEDGKVRAFRQPPAAVANLLEIARLKTAEELHKRAGQLMAGGGKDYIEGTQTGIFAGVPIFAQQDILEFTNTQLQRQAAFSQVERANDRIRIRTQTGGTPGDLQAFANFDEQRKHEADINVATLDRQARLGEQLINLSTGPGGESRAIEQGYILRIKYAEQEYQIRRKIIGDTLAGEKLAEQEQEAGIQRITKLAELQHQRFESLKSSVGNLFDAAFTKSGSMVQALENFVKGIILTPIKEGISAIVAKELMPALYGKDGKGGIIGGLFSVFGGKDADPIKLATDYNTVATDSNTAAVDRLTDALQGGVPSAQADSAGGWFSHVGMPHSPLAHLALGSILGVATAAGASHAGATTATHEQVTSVFSPTMEEKSAGTGGLPAGFPGVFGAGAALAAIAPLLGLAFAGDRGRSGNVEDLGGGDSTAGLTRNAAGLYERYGTGGGASGSGEVDVEGHDLPGGLPGDFGGEVSDAAGSTALGAAAAGGKLGGLLRGGGAIAGLQLFSAGVKNDSAVGDIETIGGGALAGASIGGPMGAAIGAEVGLLTAGFRSRSTTRGKIELLAANPILGLLNLAGVFGEDKAHELADSIKTQYGVEIPANSGVLKQILQSIDQSFGGSISTGIRSPQVMQLIELYAQSTGQPFGLSNTPRAAYLTETGGGLFQSAGSANGQSYGFASNVLGNYNGQTFHRTINGSSVTTAPQYHTFSFDGPTTAAILQGQAVTAISNNPAVVAGANATNNQNSNGRRESANYYAAPTAILG
jgi:hypothetical protein